MNAAATLVPLVMLVAVHCLASGIRVDRRTPALRFAMRAERRGALTSGRELDVARSPRPVQEGADHAHRPTR